MIPILVIGSIIGVIGLVSKSKQSVSQTQTSGRTIDDPKRYLRKLVRLVRNGIDPPDWLIQCAMEEAYDAGNYRLVRQIHERFYGNENGESVTETDQDIEDQDKAIEESSQDSDTVTVSGRSSPLDGVSNSEWEEFVSKLECEKPDYSSDKHVGKYRHSVERLSQLGIKTEDVSKSEEDQYKALVSDLVDAHSRNQDLLKHVGTTIKIDEKDHCLTPSGILGLLKAAGVKGASQWISNPEDRKSFPNTTKIFLDTNGVF